MKEICNAIVMLSIDLSNVNLICMQAHYYILTLSAHGWTGQTGDQNNGLLTESNDVIQNKPATQQY